MSPVIAEATQLENHSAAKDGVNYYFIMNFTEEAQPLPAYLRVRPICCKVKVLAAHDLPQYTTYFRKNKLSSPRRKEERPWTLPFKRNFI